MKLYENIPIPNNCSITLDNGSVIMRVSLNVTKEVYSSGLLPNSQLAKGSKYYVVFDKHILKPEELNPDMLHFRYRSLTHGLMSLIRKAKANLLLQEAYKIDNSIQLSLF